MRGLPVNQERLKGAETEGWRYVESSPRTGCVVRFPMSDSVPERAVAQLCFVHPLLFVRNRRSMLASIQQENPEAIAHQETYR
jgi:hypothetical protein